MDEITLLRSKLADLESRLEEANQRKMPSVTNEWIVTECRKSINKIDRAREMYLEKHKIQHHSLGFHLSISKSNRLRRRLALGFQLVSVACF